MSNINQSEQADDLQRPALDVIYEDERLIAVDKPPGMLVHRSSIDRHETRFVLQQLRDQIGAHVYPLHRLDKPTSGVLMFAKDSQAASKLSEVLAAESTIKSYVLVCRGYVAEEGCVDKPLGKMRDFKSRDRRKRETKGKDKESLQEAVTHFSCLKHVEFDVCVDRYPTSRYSLVSARISTGRKHQIRRHFKHIAHPIIGDTRHGKSVHNRFFAEHLNCSRLLLHAVSIGFDDPDRGERVRIVAPLSGSFADVVGRFGALGEIERVLG